MPAAISFAGVFFLVNLAAGFCYNDNVKPTDKKFVIAFKKFLDWLSAGNRFADFKDGVAEGAMKDFLMK